ncbi:hypothetical protein C0J52_03354 [Blattella germanica]|nr:hypothetical protein C0J52_03354 [Blattella germanica]
MIFIWGIAGIVVFYIGMLGVGIWAGTKQKDHSDEEVMLAGRSIGTFVGILTLIVPNLLVGSSCISYNPCHTKYLSPKRDLFCLLTTSTSTDGWISCHPMDLLGYFQRIFSMKTTKGAQVLSFISFFGCIAMAIPPGFIGIAAKSTNWTLVPDVNRTLSPETDGEIILPLVLRYLTPNWVSFIGLGAISAAVMSSADASILSASSMFSRNIYRGTFRPMRINTRMQTTWVGGAYINGTAEVMFTSGLAWCQVPFGYSASLLFALVLFVRQMREANYVTMLDPFQQKYGSRVGGLMYVPAALGDVFWVGSILNALGKSAIFMFRSRIHNTISSIAPCYPLAKWSKHIWMLGFILCWSHIENTRLFCKNGPILLSVPFAYNNPYLAPDVLDTKNWVGELKTQDVGGEKRLGIPAAVKFPYYDEATQTQKFPFKTVCMLCALITHLLVSKLTSMAFENRVLDADKFDYFEDFPQMSRRRSSVLQVKDKFEGFLNRDTIKMKHRVGIANAAMVHDPTDKETTNHNEFLLQAGEREMLWVLRFTIVIISALAAAIALTVGSIYYLSVLQYGSIGKVSLCYRYTGTYIFLVLSSNCS